MKNVNIGKTGLNAFNIGLGAGVVGNAMMYPKVTEEMGKDLIHAAFDEGIDFIDTAYLYAVLIAISFMGKLFHMKALIC
ncbi:protein IolS [Bacillus subtilis subsp. subtilis str. RO-NN-1]|uniref:aldo/keto reductase n=1 Tax=Bacillus subtilis TaxID=1423 RepID=UPI00022BA9F0|nr:aldo/keto reductase [Bacillus subtilis]AEP93060.1 protein IolS [Bacillus subtilis subsp. subtilis str. RO-NN-1]UVZ57929.1 aldo/keto reductase [Bacillus subtilis]